MYIFTISLDKHEYHVVGDVVEKDENVLKILKNNVEVAFFKDWDFWYCNKNKEGNEMCDSCMQPPKDSIFDNSEKTGTIVTIWNGDKVIVDSHGNILKTLEKSQPITEYGTEIKTRFGLSDMQPLNEAKFTFSPNSEYNLIRKFLNENESERNERLAKQEEIDRMEKELHDYYSINGEHNEPKKPISRDQLIARIQQFNDVLNNIVLDLKKNEDHNAMIEYAIKNHEILFKEVLSEFNL